MVKSSFSRRPSTSLQSEVGARSGPNVTLRAPGEGCFPCPTCKRLRRLQVTKKGKPYLTCNDCGVQVFFRGRDGIRRLQGMLGQVELSGDVREISTLLEYAAFLRARRRDIRRETLVCGGNPEVELEEKLVARELARIRNVLENELRGKRRQIKQLERSE